MKIQFIRNATMKINYAGKTILTDPMLSSQGSLPSFAGIAPNPTIELPFSAEDVINGIDSVLLSHTHPDHFDEKAGEVLKKTLPLFFQPGDEERIKKEGFQNASSIDSSVLWEGIKISRTGGQHGSGKILEHMGNVSGFVFQAEGEPTLYWVGDSIWCEEVEDTIKKFHPDIIIAHTGGAIVPGYDPIIMNIEQVFQLIKAVPEAKIVAVHMEALDHCPVTRKELRLSADKKVISHEKLIIPEDGETISF
ncbi:MAG TPA: MBL fold metallo-hydrolase [Spirochaetia bacterium]|nr:MAG: MBL fold metallo-hydrolase [Spirochaetes bacterium GWB1_36_13]HCL56321.1 MBL fold metallo-hydrolase [Spirochaetia bacterium]